MAQQRLAPAPINAVFVNETVGRQALAVPAAYLNTKAQTTPPAAPFNRAPYFTYLEM